MSPGRKPTPKVPGNQQLYQKNIRSKCLRFERRPDIFVLVGGGALIALALPVSLTDLTASHPKVHLDGFRRLEGLVATGSFKGESIMAFLKRDGEECSLG